MAGQLLLVCRAWLVAATLLEPAGQVCQSAACFVDAGMCLCGFRGVPPSCVLCLVQATYKCAMCILSGLRYVHANNSPAINLHVPQSTISLIVPSCACAPVVAVPLL